MLRNQTNHKNNMSTSKLFILGSLFLLQASCGGGGESNSEASAIGIEDVSIAFVKRPTPRDQNDDVISNDMREPTSFTEGGDLYLKARASATASTINITGRITNGVGDVKDVSSSFDGTKLIFSLRLEDLTNGNNPPKWYLYEYEIASDTLTQLTSAGAADGDDVSPHYLPEDGRIIFASTRKPQSKGILGNESRQQIVATDENRQNSAFALHIREKNGDIIQVSYNQSHDLDPIVLADSGRILFSRWNHAGGGPNSNSGSNSARNEINLYSMNPDGSDVQLYYGAHSHRTGQDPNSDIHFSKPQEMEDGRILAILRPLVTSFGGGDITFINGKDFADNTQPIWSQQAVVTGTAQATFKQNVNNASGLSLKGRYSAVFPLLDGSNRYLMSWSQCQILIDPLILFDPADPTANIIPCTLATQAQLTDPAVVEAPPSFGVVLVDGDTQVPLILPEADTLFSEVVMTYAVKTPPVIFDQVPGVTVGVDETFAKEGVGVLHIRSVYDFDDDFGDFANNTNFPTSYTPEEMANPNNNTADQRPARFIRITKGVSLPDPDVRNIDNAAFGVSTQQGMREIVGYAPIEPDGSVKIKVPANVALTLGILDKNGRRISSRHQSWFQVNPGETLECVGCHVHDTADQANNKPHGRPDYTSRFNGGATSTGVAFPNSEISLFGQFEETMAEARARHSCTDAPPCVDMKPSTDLVYTDVWTDPVVANRSKDAGFTIDYAGPGPDPGVPVSPFAAPVASTSSACGNDYSDPITTASFVNCRIVINYQTHIQPIWETTVNRPAAANCTSCHTATGFAHLTAGQLELTSGPSADEAEHLISYRELLVNDNLQEDNGGTLRDVMVDSGNFLLDGNGDQVLDINGDPIPIQVPVNVPATMSTAGALSRTFITIMTEDRGLVADANQHHLMLTQSELKLISEWLDIGAQYFNDPFNAAVPTN